MLARLSGGEGEYVGVGDVGDVGELPYGGAVAIDLDVWGGSGGDGERFRDDSRMVGVAMRAGCARDAEASQGDGAEGASRGLVGDELFRCELRSSVRAGRCELMVLADWFASRGAVDGSGGGEHQTHWFAGLLGRSGKCREQVRGSADVDLKVPCRVVE